MCFEYVWHIHGLTRQKCRALLLRGRVNRSLVRLASG